MKSITRNLIPALILSLASSCSSTSTAKKSVTIDGLLNIAAAAINEGDHIMALETLNQVRELDASNPRAYHLYALAYLGKQEIGLAEHAARQAIRLDPKYSIAKNTLGKILIDLGKFTEAESELKQAAGDLLNREADRAKLNLGILYQKTMKPDLAEYWLKRAAEDRSAMACVAHYQLGKIHLEKNELPLAERSFRMSTKGTCSGMTETHLAVGQTLTRLRRYDEARAKFIEIQRLFPGTEASEKAFEYLREIP